MGGGEKKKLRCVLIISALTIIAIVKIDKKTLRDKITLLIIRRRRDVASLLPDRRVAMARHTTRETTFFATAGPPTEHDVGVTLDAARALRSLRSPDAANRIRL